MTKILFFLVVVLIVSVSSIPSTGSHIQGAPGKHVSNTQETCSYYCSSGLLKGKTLNVDLKEELGTYYKYIQKMCKYSCSCSQVLNQLLDRNKITNSLYTFFQQKLESDGCKSDLIPQPTGSSNQNPSQDSKTTVIQPFMRKQITSPQYEQPTRKIEPLYQNSIFNPWKYNGRFNYPTRYQGRFNYPTDMRKQFSPPTYFREPFYQNSISNPWKYHGRINYPTRSNSLSEDVEDEDVDEDLDEIF